MTTERILNAAHGYYELGMAIEAGAEIENLPPEVRSDTEVLKLRHMIYKLGESWELAAAVGREITRREPKTPTWWIHYAYSVRRAEGLVAAKSVLLEAERVLPEDGSVHFDLACYACQLGDFDEAKRRISNAIHFDSTYKFKALEDVDLEPLWDNISSLS